MTPEQVFQCHPDTVLIPATCTARRTKGYWYVVPGTAKALRLCPWRVVSAN